ncbi:hypothetical protein VTO42DRAFT_7235 [Malbranchea cinnamomea]
MSKASLRFSLWISGYQPTFGRTQRSLNAAHLPQTMRNTHFLHSPRGDRHHRCIVDQHIQTFSLQLLLHLEGCVLDTLGVRDIKLYKGDSSAKLVDEPSQLRRALPSRSGKDFTDLRLWQGCQVLDHGEAYASRAAGDQVGCHDSRTSRFGVVY